MSGLFSSPKPGVQNPPEKINAAGPGGSATFGTYDASGNFIPTPGVSTQLTQETDFQRQFRSLQEALTGQLADELTPNLTQPRTGAQIDATLSGTPTNALPTIGGGLPNVDPSGVTSGLTSLNTDFSGDASRVERATFDRVRNLVEPEFKQQRERLVQSLADQGLDPGGEASTRELDRLDRSQGQTYEDAALQAVQAGRAEQSRLAQIALANRGQQFGEKVTQQNLLQALRAQIFGEQSGARSQLFGENQSALQLALQRQLGLSSLESQQRGQQFGEIGALSGFVNPFTPTPVTALSGGATGPVAGGSGPQLLGTLGGALLGGPFGAAAGAAAFNSGGGIQYGAQDFTLPWLQ